MRRLNLKLFSLLAGVALTLPALVDGSSTCPEPGTWHGHAPPHGTGYFCGYIGKNGEVVRHGWAVFYHHISQAKIEECEYRDGVRHGRCTFFDESGRRLERGAFERGVRFGPWWFWSLPTQQGRKGSLTLPIGNPTAAAERRRDVEAFLTELGADATEATALAEALLFYVDREGSERRQICGEHLCVGPGLIPDEPIFVGIRPTPDQVERDRKLVAQYQARARTRVREEERAAKAAQKKIEAEQRRLERELAREERGQTCCKYCYSGQPCGDTCISRSKTCHVGRGCACAG